MQTLYLLFDGVSSQELSYKFIESFSKKIVLKASLIDSTGSNLSEILFNTHKETLNEGAIGMSTISALFVNYDNGIKYLNIGDSRIYRFTNQYIEQITVDDSIIGNRNILTKCLGLDNLTISDFEFIKIKNLKGDFVLCTDGFYLLMEENIKEFFQAFNYKKIGNSQNKLLRLVSNKNTDDASYILLKNEI